MKKVDLRLICLALLLIIIFSLSGCSEKTIESPKNISVDTVSNPNITLRWDKVKNADFYRVYRIEGNNADYRFLCDVTETKYTDNTAENGKIYGYKVTSVLGRKESEGCLSEKIKYTNSQNNTVQTPLVPTISSITNLDKHTSVILFDSANKDCTYRIMRSETQDGPFTVIGETAETAFYDTSLLDGEEYFYTVSAVNSDVASDASTPQKTGTNALDVFSAPVLMYHQFLTPEDVENGVNFGEYAIYASDFEQDLQWLQKNGYTTITTAELMQYMKGEATPPEKPIILTIDDGYRGVYLNAFPLLQKYNMKAVFSVIGDRIDAATLEDVEALHKDRLYCNWDELAVMQKSGYMEIISHTATCHNDEDMTNVRRGANCAVGESEESFYMAALPDYVNISKNFKKYFGYTAYSMSYPYSSRSITSDRVWMKCGYNILYAGNSGEARKIANNYLAVGAGITRDSAVLRRVARMNGTYIWEYVKDYY